LPHCSQTASAGRCFIDPNALRRSARLVPFANLRSNFGYRSRSLPPFRPGHCGDFADGALDTGIRPQLLHVLPARGMVGSRIGDGLARHLVGDMRVWLGKIAWVKNQIGS
jgi:hypothetical protein